MKRDIVIHNWMWKIGIKGNDLLLYAIIYEHEYYFATQKEIAELLGISLPTLVCCLNRLKNAGLIDMVNAKREYSIALAYHAIDKQNISKRYE